MYIKLDQSKQGVQHLNGNYHFQTANTSSSFHVFYNSRLIFTIANSSFIGQVGEPVNT